MLLDEIATARRTYMKTSIGLLLLFLSLPALAQEPSQTILSSVGAADGWTGIETLSLGWSLDHGYRNVRLAARLANGGGSGRGIAYLMRAMGPGTTCASEVAQVSFDLPLRYDGMFVLFENLDLGPGDYWLVFSKPRHGPFSYANWMAGFASNITKASDVHYLGMAWVNAEELIGEYVPASAFNVRTDAWAYQLEIRGEAVPAPPRRRIAG
jgi:hypothetical protein